jgi:hypothetical protein
VVSEHFLVCSLRVSSSFKPGALLAVGTCKVPER